MFKPAKTCGRHAMPQHIKTCKNLWRHAQKQHSHTYLAPIKTNLVRMALLHNNWGYLTFHNHLICLCLFWRTPKMVSFLLVSVENQPKKAPSERQTHLFINDADSSLPLAARAEAHPHPAQKTPATRIKP